MRAFSRRCSNVCFCRMPSAVRQAQKHVAVTGQRRAPADQILAAQFPDVGQESAFGEPVLVFCNDGSAVAVTADNEWIASLRGPPDIDAPARPTVRALVEDTRASGHCLLSPLLRQKSPEEVQPHGQLPRDLGTAVCAPWEGTQ
jgi:hypothetical protein